MSFTFFKISLSNSSSLTYWNSLLVVAIGSPAYDLVCHLACMNQNVYIMIINADRVVEFGEK